MKDCRQEFRRNDAEAERGAEHGDNRRPLFSCHLHSLTFAASAKMTWVCASYWNTRSSTHARIESATWCDATSDELKSK